MTDAGGTNGPVDEPLGRIDPADLETTLRVLSELQRLHPDHEDVRTVKRAASYMYKMIKKSRRAEIRSIRIKHDQDIIEKTATGSALRIDDETAGIPLVSTAKGAFAGELITARGCYICKQDFTLVDAFYHWLCPSCAAFSHSKRDQRTDLTGKRALLTGGRAKIGMYIALRLLRDGAHTTITTRFPKDAVRRFAAMEDSADWLHRLKIVGIDLRDPTQVISLTDDVAADGPLDIIINNACQTVRRLPGAYAHLIDGELAPLPDLPELPEMVTFDRISEAHPAAIAGALSSTAVAHHDGETEEHALAAHNAASLTALALKAGGASLDAHLAGTAIDAGGLIPDIQDNNSWTQVLDEVDPLELLEVQFCNSIAPFLINSRLRPALRAAVQNGARRAYIVNVSAMEGQFGGRRYKGAGHPHTNMAKAALNMMTRTSAGEMFETDKILMTAVDTGWITDERPHHEKLRIAAEGWHAPLDLVDGAARVYDPIVLGEAGEDLYGCFVKDYKPSPW
ncbi:SDR family NAD(P)-dependent oxidoreductase [Nocardioides marmorisolisilvae]|uniref:SDR family NAD(P)-dependent oxidoreductase n=1 Tax=Nocardioides marmorisolisilvae TaxID=1542737 RepID=A0A3N0E0Z6_9ACTN|nr:SDR family NAD(P)-dependent oxidoreductase [Nocardioides marmorisolisilvae]RNL81423.1 SDR family NAD(P)-dependent oxidoreductase [Nocardioides marmorisolisilvae]